MAAASTCQIHGTIGTRLLYVATVICPESIVNATNVEFPAANCSFAMPLGAGICRVDFPNGILGDLQPIQDET